MKKGYIKPDVDVVYAKLETSHLLEMSDEEIEKILVRHRSNAVNRSMLTETSPREFQTKLGSS